MTFRILIYLGLILISLGVKSQTHYLVYLKPKDTKKTSLALSEDAINRKKKIAIPFDERDYSIELDRLATISRMAPIQKSSRWLNAASIIGSKEDVERILKLEFVDKVEILSVNGNKQKSTLEKLEANYTKEQYGSAYSQLELHGGDKLHSDGFEGQGMRIAIFDAGFENVDKIVSFKHLFIENRIFPVRNIVENSNKLFTLDGHGTSVLGCMASYVKDTIIASAPKASYYLFITEDPRSESKQEELNWAIAAEMADSMGLDIINSSLGYHQFDDPSQNYTRDDMNGKTTIVSKAATIAVAKGIVVVNSAGNHGNKDWNIITAPADVEGVISVGALDIQKNLADFSSKGFYKSTFVKPNLVAVGKGTTLYYDQGAYSFGSGTSFSSPVLAGLIACFWQKNRTLKPQELKSLIYSTGNLYLKPNLEKGYGIPRFDKSINFDQIKMKDRVLSVYPNPSEGNTILEISSSEALENAELEIYFGSKAISKSKIDLFKGVNHILINTDHYAKGLYFFKVKMGNYILEERYLKN